MSPFYEDKLDELRTLLGTDRILMGSDYPHAEGLADPSSYIKDLRNFDFTDDAGRADHARQRHRTVQAPPRLTFWAADRPPWGPNRCPDS